MSLPSDFIWGFATAAYQVEGATEQDGRGPSIWDAFCKVEGKIAGAADGSVACDSYNRTAEDIALLKELGRPAYRFSISWSRVIPLGGRGDPVNQAGLDHYARFVDDLLAAGIEPMITLFHWDLPEALDRRYGGLLSREEFPLDFERYARVVFAAIPRCRYWITINEPWCSSVFGYGTGGFAPGRSSDHARSPSGGGDSSREPWVAGHNLLVAHGRAVKAYRDDFQKGKSGGAAAGGEEEGGGGGRIGITLNGDYTYPWDAADPRDVEAAERKLEFSIGWFADPIYLGGYPASMRRQLGGRLPEFTAEELALVRGSNDFYGMNHYTADYVRHGDGRPSPEDYLGDLTTHPYSRRLESIGPETESFWLRPNPAGFRALIGWLSRRYGYPDIYVTENGTSVKGESQLATMMGDKDDSSTGSTGSSNSILDDELRCLYFETYTEAMARAVAEDGCRVRGYMAWSLMDNFEWAEGYNTRFGCVYVDYADGQRRQPKRSARRMKGLFDALIKSPDSSSAAAVRGGSSSAS